MDALSLQQSVIANNIANVDTPNFRASQVEFQSAFNQALSDGTFTTGDGKVNIGTSPTATPVGANGNNVDVQTETINAMQASFQYQVMSKAFSDMHTRMTTVAV
jgi:flagellar basal-body rod protein FlgB